MQGKSKKVLVLILSVSKDSAKIIKKQFVDYTTTEIKYKDYLWYIDASNPSLRDLKDNPIILLDLRGKKIIFEKTSEHNDAQMDGLLIGNCLIRDLAKASMPIELRKKKTTLQEFLLWISLFLTGLFLGIGLPVLLSYFGGA